FYYGTILTDGGDGAARPSTNVCVFADRQVDRSATGSGVTARLAVEHARGRARPAAEYRFRSLTGDVFTGRIGRSSTAGARGAVEVSVGGSAYVTGRARCAVGPEDPLGGGFRFNWGSAGNEHRLAERPGDRAQAEPRRRRRRHAAVPALRRAVGDRLRH